MLNALIYKDTVVEIRLLRTSYIHILYDMKLIKLPPNVPTEVALKHAANILHPMPLKRVFIAAFTLILLTTIFNIYKAVNIPIVELLALLPKMIITHPSGFIGYVAESIGGIILPIIHITISSIWEHKRNSYTRRKIMFNWILALFILLGLQIIFYFSDKQISL
ncbi:TPA: hypothetical protein ACN32I_004709 [Vibrio parahaemolyticus]